MASAIALVTEPGIKKNHANAGEGTAKLAATIQPHVKNLLPILILCMTDSPKKPKKAITAMAYMQCLGRSELDLHTDQESANVTGNHLVTGLQADVVNQFLHDARTVTN